MKRINNGVLFLLHLQNTVHSYILLIQPGLEEQLC